MKKSLSIFFAGVAVICGLASCNKNLDSPSVNSAPASQETGTGELKVSLLFDEQTKASAYTDVRDCEKKINNVQLLVFDASTGLLDEYKNLGTSTSVSLNVAFGKKNVWALVNAPSMTSIKALNTLKMQPVKLGENNSVSGSSFVMTGSEDVTVSTGSTVNCEINVSRMVSRIAATKIINELPEAYGSVTLTGVFLSNVVGSAAFGTAQTSPLWYNKEGRYNESTLVSEHIIDGSDYKADAEEMTWNGTADIITNGNSTSWSEPKFFYAFPNNSTNVPTAFYNPFEAEATRLIVSGTVDGQRRFWPVVLTDLAANTAYTVELTIKSKGVDDPEKIIENGGVSVSIKIDGWNTGTVYSPSL